MNTKLTGRIGNGLRARRVMLLLAAGLLAWAGLMLPGCILVSSSRHPAPTPAAPPEGLRLPAGAVLVGGGGQIEFTAPTDGVVFLVDVKRQEMIQSQSLAQNAVYRFAFNTAKFDLGMMHARAVSNDDPGAIALYFVAGDALRAATTQPGG